MKKKIYFYISAALQIIMAIFVIVASKYIAESQIGMIEEAYGAFPAEFQQKMISMAEGGATQALLIIGAIVQIILNIFIMEYASKNIILKKKGKIIGFSVISLFIGGNSIIELLSVVNIIVLAFSKRKNPEDFPDKKLEIPKLEYEKSTKKEKICGLALAVIYFSQLFVDKAISPELISEQIGWLIIIGFYIIMFTLSIIVMKDRIKRDAKLFKENFKAYRQYVIPKWGIMYIIYFAVALGSVIITGKASSVNQSELSTLPFWFTVPAAVIWAPIVEETIFRGVLRKFIKNNTLFIILSATIFGLLHTVSESSIFDMLILGLPYSVLGGFLAYIYAKTENISNNMLVHCIHNAVVITIMMLTSAGM